jgi:N-acetylneuraminic acid mutarotase
MPPAQLEKKVDDYLRNSQALEDYWQQPLSAEQLQAEMKRMAQHTKQPEVLRELFEALGNDPFVIAECLARPALSERLVTNWYAHDQRFHGELRQRAEADLRAHNTVEQMKQTSGKYSEIELVRSDSARHEENRGPEHSVKLNIREWDETVQKLAALFGGGANTGRTRTGVLSRAVAAGVPGSSVASREDGSPGKAAPITQIKPGVLRPLQEDEGRYYATAVIEKTADHLKLATVSWLKEPLESWLARVENNAINELQLPAASHRLPKIEAGGCIDDTWTATASLPDARDSHSAVWTGSEMIVWGGGTDGGDLNTGARYNPSTDTWTAMSIANAPAARSDHTAVWSGSEMIVWGGQEENLELANTGGRYNPNTDSWTPTTITNAPAARSRHTAVWTGNEMIVWGGYDGTSYLNTGARYNPNTDSWTATGTTNAPDARTSHTAVWSGDEMIVWGGTDGVSYFNTGGSYSVGTDSWTASSTTNAPIGRERHTAVWTGGEMIVWGGVGEFGTFNTGGRYDPGANSWTATSTTNAPDPRYSQTAVWTGNEMIVWGGINSGFSYNTGGRYSPGTNSWTATSTIDAPAARLAHTVVWTGSEMIVWGGLAGSFVDVDTGGRYDPIADIWADTGDNNVPHGRIDPSAVWTGTEMIVWGGYNPANPPFLNTGGKYYPVTDSWTATSTTNAPDPRQLHSTIWTGSEMIIWGGQGFSGFLDSGGRYNPVTDSWAATSTTNAPSARYYQTAVWTGSNMIVWGGYDGSYLNTGATYNPSTDSWTATSTTRRPIASHSSLDRQ